MLTLFQAFNVEETIAVSSQVMNRNNHRIVLEEILKVNDIKRKDLPENIDNMTPADQVSATCLPYTVGWLIILTWSEQAMCYVEHFHNQILRETLQ